MIDCWLWDVVDCMRHEEETYTEGSDPFMPSKDAKDAKKGS